MDAAAFASGFLDIIGSSNRGNGLRASADFLQPSLEILEALLAPRRQVEAFVSLGSVNSGTNDFQGIFTVPQGQVWRLHAGCYRTSNQNGDSENFNNNVFLIETPNPATILSGSAVVVYQWPDQAALSGAARDFGWTFPNPLWCSAGSRIGFRWFLTGVGAPVADFSASLLIDRFNA